MTKPERNQNLLTGSSAVAVAPAEPAPVPDVETALLIFDRMLRIRKFEQRLERLFDERELRGTAHSAVGQEAIAAGACLATAPGDLIFSHHRGHGHLLAMGGSFE